MQPHNFLDLGGTRQIGARLYRLCGIEGCEQVGNHPVHRVGPPKARGVRESDRHAPRIGLNKKCTTCGKARQSLRHRGFEPVVIEFPKPKSDWPDDLQRHIESRADALRESRAIPTPLGGEALLLVALGYAEALQSTEDGKIKTYAGLLARAIKEELGREPEPEPIATQEVVEGYHAKRPKAFTIQAGTAGMRRAFKSDNLRRLFDFAVNQGWTWRRNGGGHVLISSPGQKEHMSLSLTLSDSSHGRAWGNAKAEAKRKGLDIAGL
jgi:hypothetical protein